jgi:hypothetical protein
VSNLPIAPVKQRASDDIPLLVRFESGLAEIHYYREGAVEYLTTRYAEPTKDSGLRWQITRTEET